MTSIKKKVEFSLGIVLVTNMFTIVLWINAKNSKIFCKKYWFLLVLTSLYIFKFLWNFGDIVDIHFYLCFHLERQLNSKFGVISPEFLEVANYVQEIIFLFSCVKNCLYPICWNFFSSKISHSPIFQVHPICTILIEALNRQQSFPREAASAALSEFIRYW